MIVEITRIYNIHSKKDPSRLIKKNVLVKKAVHLSHITNPSEITDIKGNIIKDKCQIHLRNEGLIIINHSYGLISTMLLDTFYPEHKPIGFSRFFKEQEEERLKEKRKLKKEKNDKNIKTTRFRKRSNTNS
tara:strand:+ start:47759 stop:48151 length:393 start_codon:yes stop_codon:yes gene_type:complete